MENKIDNIIDKQINEKIKLKRNILNESKLMYMIKKSIKRRLNETSQNPDYNKKLANNLKSIINDFIRSGSLNKKYVPNQLFQQLNFIGRNGMSLAQYKNSLKQQMAAIKPYVNDPVYAQRYRQKYNTINAQLQKANTWKGLTENVTPIATPNTYAYVPSKAQNANSAVNDLNYLINNGMLSKSYVPQGLIQSLQYLANNNGNSFAQQKNKQINYLKQKMAECQTHFNDAPAHAQAWKEEYNRYNAQLQQLMGNGAAKPATGTAKTTTGGRKPGATTTGGGKPGATTTGGGKPGATTTGGGKPGATTTGGGNTNLSAIQAAADSAQQQFTQMNKTNYMQSPTTPGTNVNAQQLPLAQVTGNAQNVIGTNMSNNTQTAQNTAGYQPNISLDPNQYNQQQANINPNWNTQYNA